MYVCMEISTEKKRKHRPRLAFSAPGDSEGLGKLAIGEKWTCYNPISRRRLLTLPVAIHSYHGRGLTPIGDSKVGSQTSDSHM